MITDEELSAFTLQQMQEQLACIYKNNTKTNIRCDVTLTQAEHRRIVRLET